VFCFGLTVRCSAGWQLCTGRTSAAAATDAAAPACSKMERSAIASLTRVNFPKHELLQLMHEHLTLAGLKHTAQTLAQEAALFTPWPVSSPNLLHLPSHNILRLPPPSVPSAPPLSRVLPAPTESPLARANSSELQRTSANSSGGGSAAEQQQATAPGGVTPRGRIRVPLSGGKSTAKSEQSHARSLDQSQERLAAHGAAKTPKRTPPPVLGFWPAGQSHADMEQSHVDLAVDPQSLVTPVGAKRKHPAMGGGGSPHTPLTPLGVVSPSLKGPGISPAGERTHAASYKFGASSGSGSAGKGDRSNVSFPSSPPSKLSRPLGSHGGGGLRDRASHHHRIDHHHVAGSTPFGVREKDSTKEGGGGGREKESGCGVASRLDSIMTQYLRHQHRQCPAPITTCPPFR
jgi:HIV-1 Vpr-binding protein